jgi:hypothetical protein
MGTGTFWDQGTATVTPAAVTGPCLQTFVDSSSSSFPFENSFFPAAPGHYHFAVGSAFPGAVGEINFNVVQLP